MAQRLIVLPFLQRTQVWFRAPTSGDSQLPVTAVLGVGYPLASVSTRHKAHMWTPNSGSYTHIHIHINKNK